MFHFKLGFALLSASYSITILSVLVEPSEIFDTGLAFIYMGSGAIAGKILYDRYQQIHILGSLTHNPKATCFANNVSSLSAVLLLLGFLIHFIFYLFKVDDYCLIALSIFTCGCGTLYIWLQCIITTYVSSMYYDKRLTALRQWLVNAGFLVLLTMALFATVSTVLPRGSWSGFRTCLLISTLCSYTLAAIFCVFIMTFEKEYEYFSDFTHLRSDMLLDDECSINGLSYSEANSMYGTQEINSYAVPIKGNFNFSKFF